MEKIKKTKKTRKKGVFYKFFISLFFGAAGFLINLYPVKFVFLDYQSGFMLGLVFPIVIALAWGWRYGLLSATFGMGCQNGWFIWYEGSGYPAIVLIFSLVLWVIWHGVCASSYRKRRFFGLNPYFAEIFFRFAYAFLILVVWRRAFQFNPAPFSSEAAPLSASFSETNFILIKNSVNGFLVILISGVLLNLGIIRRLLKLKERINQNDTDYIISVSFALGLLVWVIDSISNYFFFHFPKGSFINFLLFDIPPYELYVRITFVLACLMGGLVAARHIRKGRKIQEDLPQIVEANTIATFIVDRKHQVTSWNKACEKLTGFSEGAMIGFQKQWKPFYPKKRPLLSDLVLDGASESEVKKYYPKSNQQSILVKGGYEAEDFIPAVGKGGKWFLFTASPLKDTKGRIVGAVEMIQDITEYKRTEIELRREREKSQSYLDMAEAILFVLDPKGEVVFINKKGCAILGYGQGEVVGKDWFEDFLPEGIKAKEKETFKKLISGEVLSVGLYELVLLDKDGNNKTFLMKTTIRKDIRENVIGTLSSGKDITESKSLKTESFQLTKLADGNPNPILRVSREGIVLYHNKASLDLLEAWKYKKDKPIPEYWRQFALDALNSKAPKQIEEKIGERIYSLVFAPIMDSTYVNVYAFDITERKEAEKKIAKLAKSSDGNPNFALRISGDGVILYDNKSNFTLMDEWQYQEGQLLSDYWHQFVLDALSSGTPQKTEVKFGKRIFSLTFGPVKESNYVNVYGFDITDSKHLREEVSQLSELSDENPNPVFRVSEEGIVVYKNKASLLLLEAWGYKEGKPLADYLRQFALDALSSGHSKQSEERVDSSIFSLTFVPEKSSRHINVYGFDITENKRINIKTARLVKIADENPSPVIRVSPQGKVLYSNKAGSILLESWGYNKGEILPEYWLKFALQAFKSGASIQAEAKVADKFFSLTFSPETQSESINIYGFDISELKRLKEESAQLAKLADGNPNPILRISRDGVVLYHNKASLDLLKAWKYQEGQILSEKWHKVVVDALDLGIPRQVDMEIDKRVYSIIFAPIMDSTYVNVYAFDITERKIAEKKISDLAESAVKDPNLVLRISADGVILYDNKASFTALEEWRYREGQLLTGYWHQFVLSALSYEMSQHVESEFSGRIFSLTFEPVLKSNYVNVYANDITEHKRQREQREKALIEQELKNAEKENDINEIVKSVYEELTNLATTKGLDFTIDLAENLPKAKFDKEKITQALTNIVKNSINSTDIGSVRVETSQEGANTLHVAVKDTGSGIKQEDLPKVFDIFEQLEKSEAEEVKSSGLDLVIARRIIEKHKGKVWAESRIKKGSIFHFILPIKERRYLEADGSRALKPKK